MDGTFKFSLMKCAWCCQWWWIFIAISTQLINYAVDWKIYCLKFSGPTPDVDIVLSICLQSDIPAPQPVKSGTAHVQFPSVPAPSTSDLSVSSKSHPIPSGSSFKPTRGKRKNIDSMCFLFFGFFLFLFIIP